MWGRVGVSDRDVVVVRLLMIKVRFTKKELLDIPSITKLNLFVLERLLSKQIPAFIKNGQIKVLDGRLSIVPELHSQYITYEYSQ